MRFFPQSDKDERPILVWTGTDEDVPDCAWCLSEQGRDFGNGSHGICPAHSAQFLQQYKAEKQKRQRH
jgi:hypothetical protein